MIDPVIDPLVTVLIASYNASRYLAETLDSALAQTYPRCEIIVVDDGSTDDTVLRIKPYSGRIRFLRREHGGLAAARNAGIQIASGDYIALLDADDLWLPEKISKQVGFARRNPRSGMIVCDGKEFGHDRSRPYLLSGSIADALRRTSGGVVTRSFHRELIKHPAIRCPAQTLLPRRVVEEVGPFANFDAQDYDYYLRVSARFPSTFHADSLVRWRDHESSMSGPRVLRELTWSRQKLKVLRAYARRSEPFYRKILEHQLIWNRAEVAFHHGELFHRRCGLRALILLLRSQPWPPIALPFLLAHASPRLGRIGRKVWRDGGLGDLFAVRADRIVDS
jgi:glycosyltransferase involved in cell wall biosynthesis